MAILLPAVAFALLVSLVGTLAPARSADRGGWERPVLLAAPLWGSLLVAILELLGTRSAVRQVPLAVAWLLVDVALLAGLSLVARRRGWGAIWRPARPDLTPGEWAFTATLGALLLCLLVVALVAPPNNVDSLLYHMARVVHWAQNGSLDHYATAYGHQVWMPPWAEMAILNARVLWGSDRPAGLVQWMALVGCLVAVSGLGRVLGLKSRGRMLAVAFTFSIPMAPLQATSTQNDLVAAYWLLSTVFLVLLIESEGEKASPLEWAALGASLGLGLLSKGTLYLLLLPVVALFLLWRNWRERPRRAFGEVLLVFGLAVAINLGHWTRNMASGGTPLGPIGFLAGHGVVEGQISAVLHRLQLAPLLLFRAVLLHFATPFDSINRTVGHFVEGLQGDVLSSVEPYWLEWGWNHEDTAGFPLHVLVIGVALIAAAASWRKQSPATRAVLLTSLGGYALLVVLTGPPSLPFGTRHQFPVFVISAPWVVAVAMRLRPQRSMAPLFSLTLLLLSVPFALFNDTRPLFGLRPDADGPWELPCPAPDLCTRIGSVLTMSDVDILFAGQRQYQGGSMAMVAALEEADCRRLGLRIDSHDPEYVFWHLLKAPQSGYRLEAVYTAPGLEFLLDRSFKPCAIVCTICGDRTRLHGLELHSAWQGTALFLGDGFSWDKDG